MVIEKALQFQGKKLSYRIVGDGPTVALLHGVPFDGNLWEGQAGKLSGFKLIIPDLPGSGSSEMIDDMSMEGMAEVIKGILDVESSKVGTCILIGHSMGGYISLAFAEKYPSYLRGLGLFHSTAYPDSEDRKAMRKKAIETIKSNGAPAFLRTAIPNLFSPQSKEKMRGTIDQFIESTNNFSPLSLVSYYEAMMQRPDRTSVLKTIKIPMLFVAGKYDHAAPLNDLLKLCHLPEISYFHILDEAGHMGMIEETEKSKTILNDYLINVS
ncbi:MAG TPA: alpha/beta hydrolase [Chitinophagaceae bacterium]|nr:alpha/beta hydrolase [Chitinophagaceae bacterium]